LRGNKLRGRATCCGQQVACCRQQVVCCPQHVVRPRNNFVDGNKEHMLRTTSNMLLVARNKQHISRNMLRWCKRGLTEGNGEARQNAISPRAALCNYYKVLPGVNTVLSHPLISFLHR